MTDSEGLDLEALIESLESTTLLAVGPEFVEEHTPHYDFIHEASALEPTLEVEAVRSFDELDTASLDQYLVCFVSDQGALGHTIPDNSQYTPVFYVPATQEEADALTEGELLRSSEGRFETALSKHNLFDFEPVTHFHAEAVAEMGAASRRMAVSVRKALDARRRLARCLRKAQRMGESLPDEVVRILTQQPEKPRFLHLLSDLDAQINTDARRRDERIVRHLALHHDAVQQGRVLQQHESAMLVRDLDDFFAKLHEGAERRLGDVYVVGEGIGVLRLAPTPAAKGSLTRKDIDFSVIRPVRPAPQPDGVTYDAMDIATQRCRDSWNLRETKAQKNDLGLTLWREESPRQQTLFSDGTPVFKTARVLRPYLYKGQAVLLMERARGPTVERILARIRREKEAKTATRGIHRERLLTDLQRLAVEKCVYDAATFNKLVGGAGNLETFIPRPDGAHVVKMYKARVGNLAELFEDIAPGLFSDGEREAYGRALDCFDLIDVSPENIGRKRDTSLANVCVKLDRVTQRTQGGLDFTLDGVLKDLTGRTRIGASSQIKPEEINKRFIHVDVHHDYGHVLEDWAQIVTWHEVPFLLNEGAWPKARLPHLDYFLNHIEREDLKGDLRSAHIVCAYRTMRKLKLFVQRYVGNARRDFEEGRLREDVYLGKLGEFQDIILHYARLSERIFRIVAQDPIGIIGNGDLSDGERAAMTPINQAYKAELGKHSGISSRDFSETLKPETGSPELAQAYLNVCTMALAYRKLRSYLNRLKKRGDSLNWKTD